MRYILVYKLETESRGKMSLKFFLDQIYKGTPGNLT